MNILSKKAFPLRNLVITSISLCLCVLAIFFLLKARNLPPQTPLFYGLAQGEGQLANTNLLILPIGISLFLLFANISISIFLKDDFLKKALVVAGAVTIVFSLITVLRIIFLVGAF